MRISVAARTTTVRIRAACPHPAPTGAPSGAAPSRATNLGCYRFNRGPLRVCEAPSALTIRTTRSWTSGAYRGLLYS